MLKAVQGLYNVAHNFEIRGEIHRRKFATPAKEDFSAKLRSALTAMHKKEFSCEEPLNESLVKGMVLDGEFDRLCLLGKANGLIDRVDNGFIYFNKV